jgi:hypothetical protein
MSCVKPDGGIYGKGLANYNTSVVVHGAQRGRPGKI